MGESLTSILSSVTELTTSLGSMLSFFMSYWFVFLPILFVVFRFLFGRALSLLQFKRGRRRR